MRITRVLYLEREYITLKFNILINKNGKIQ